MLPQTTPETKPTLIPATLPDDGQVLRMLITNAGVTPSIVTSVILVGAVPYYSSSVGEGWIEWNSAVGGLTDVGTWKGTIANGTYLFAIYDAGEVLTWEDLVVIAGSVLDPPEVTLA